MSVFKQVHNKFWQNDFVLGLTAEERYFYIYLITNSMTTQCGIYKFNRRLAELETGFTQNKIAEFLKRFEEYGKIKISKTSTEIMIINWFKHNFKSSKKSIQLINRELRDVKDTAFLDSLYDFCVKRQYPTAEIFSGVILMEKEKIVDKFIEKNSDEAGVDEQIQEDIQAKTVEEVITNLDPSCEQDKHRKEQKGVEENNLFKLCKSRKGKSGPVEGEELVSEEFVEEGDIEDAGGGTVVASWSFAEGSEVAADELCSLTG